MNNLKFNHDPELIDIQLLTIEDAHTLYSLIDESRSELKNLIWSQNATLETTTEFIHSKKQSKDKIYGVFYSNILVGVLELREKETMSELGYWIGSRFRGQGLMKIAVKKLVDEKIKLHTIIAHIREINKASYKILKYAGLEYNNTEVWQNEEWLHLKRNKE